MTAAFWDSRPSNKPCYADLKISRTEMKLSPTTIKSVDSSGNTSTTSIASSTAYTAPAPLFQPPNYSLPSPKSLSSDTGATTKAASPMTPTQVESLLEIISSVEAEAPIREQAGSENAREEEGGPQITGSSPLPEPSSIAILTSLFGWCLASPCPHIPHIHDCFSFWVPRLFCFYARNSECAIGYPSDTATAVGNR